ncbi:MAG: hypothetical protein C5B54_03540 [Acidobacteria bacterium]|nr:MAG: hypothetical protein C5B54_03540 [Acidobacteriota bacterium]
MPLSAGRRLGPYEILAPIGAGGMGEVYRGKDTRLDRNVAIKILPSHLSDNIDLKQRFEREARTISGLNHPHICTLHDVGDQDGINFLVMEYIEGETLASRLSKGALSLDQTLRYGMQIAEALDRAHRSGVIHRDLKPGNIMLTKSGIKLLDFGLAKFQLGMSEKAVSSVSGLATELTPHNPLTNEGTILGTVQYMSPEQLEGQDADARSDLWAFGCVLYEMATGKRAFEGKSQASIIAAIMHSQPAPMASLQPLTQPSFEHVVTTCLAKDPDERWQSAGDVRQQLQWISSASQSITLPKTVVRRNNRELFAWIVVILLMAALSFLIFLRRQPEKKSLAQVSRFTIDLPAGTELSPYDSLVLSPDGKNVAFTSLGLDRSHLWIRSLDEVEPRMLPETEDARFPFWSPDSRYVGFFAQGKLKKIEISGGSPETITDAQDARGGSWNSEGTIIFARNFYTPLYAVSHNGGNLRPVTSLKSPIASASNRWPWFLPDQKHFLYLALTSTGGNSRGQFCVGSLDDQKATCFANGSSKITYLPSGYVMYIRDSALVAQRFDVNSLHLTGNPISVVPDIGQYFSFGPSGHSPFSASDTGVLMYSKVQYPSAHVRMYDRNGVELKTFSSAGLFTEPFVSSDGQKMAINRQDATGSMDVWFLDLGRDALTRLTFNSAIVWSPVISPDASQLVYTGTRPGFGVGDLFETTTNGTGTPRLLWESDTRKLADDWSPDGSTLLVDVSSPQSRTDIWAVPMKGNEKPYPVIQTPFEETGVRFSPDGHFIAYSSDESGHPEIYVQTFPVSGQKWQISTEGGEQAQWSSDGKEIFYLSSSIDLMAVDIKSSSRFETGVPHKLFHPSIPKFLANLEGRNQFAVDPRGRFLIVSGDTTVESTQITVVQNWQSLIDSLK